MKQSKNEVTLNGILVDNKLSLRNGANGDYISGSITLRVEQKVSGKDEIEDVQVSTYVSQLTKAGTENPAFVSLKNIIDNAISLSAATDPTMVSKIVIRNANLRENYYSPDGQKVYCTPKVQATFMNIANGAAAANFVPSATFTVNMVVGNIEDELDSEGNPTKRLKVKGIVGTYNGTAENFDFFVENENAINYIRSYWQIGDTVQVSGKLRFTYRVEQYEVPTRFGDPVFKSRTITCKEFIITADSTDALKDEEKFTEEEIKEGLAKRAELIEKAKVAPKSSNSTATTTTNKATNNNPYGF